MTDTPLHLYNTLTRQLEAVEPTQRDPEGHPLLRVYGCGPTVYSLARLVKQCRDIPGYTLFQYHTDAGKNAIGSGDVNAYLRETTGEAFSAKDFRTWGGTVLAAKALRARGAAEDEKAADKHCVDVVKEVSEGLGNTVAVCRKYYVHPDIVAAYCEGTLIDAMKRRNAGNTPAGLEPEEAAVLSVLKERLKG